MLDAGAHRGDDPGCLMACDVGEVDIAPDALHRLVVRGADAAGDDSDDDVTRARLGDGDVTQLELVEVMQNGGEHKGAPPDVQAVAACR